MSGLFHVSDETISPTGMGDDPTEQGELQALESREKPTVGDPAPRAPQECGADGLVKLADASSLWNGAASKLIVSGPVVLLRGCYPMFHSYFGTSSGRQQDTEAREGFLALEPPGISRTIQDGDQRGFRKTPKPQFR